MEAILLARKFTANKTWYDLRYFYFNDQDVGCSTCGMAFRALLAVYRQHKVTLNYKIAEWYEAISLSPNHTVLGYLVEQMCLTAIQHGALRGTALQEIDEALGNRLEEKEFFDNVPPVAKLINGHDDLRLYIPTVFNFPDIDGAIVRLDRVEKKAYVYLIQVMIAENHKDSEENFYLKQWDRWEKMFVVYGYHVSSMFVWIDTEKPSTKNGLKEIESTRRSTRKTEKTVVAEHQSTHISIKSLDSVLNHYMIAI